MFFLIFLFLIGLYRSQSYTLIELNEKTNEYINKGDVGNAIKINLKASHDFEKTGNNEAVANAYINIGTLFWSLARYQESLQYLDKAKAKLSKVQNSQLQAKLYNEYGRNYNALELFEQSNINLNKVLGYIKNLPKEHKNLYLYHVFFRKWENFEMLKQHDSAYAMRNKCLKTLPTAVTYTRIADLFIKQKIHLDSADFYLNKAILEEDYHFPYNEAIVYKISGDLHRERGEKEKALEAYFHFLNLSQQMKRKVEIREAYDKIHNIYKLLGNNEKSSEFLEKYKILNDSIKNEEKKTMNFVINDLQEEKAIEKKQQRNNLINAILVVCFITIVSILIIYIIKKKYSKKQEKAYQIIERKSIETFNLNKKVNESFGEVIQLAKDNDPFFITRFKEVYSEFYERLLQYSPKLTSKDIRLAAYIRLNLSAKEIASFENLTLRSVETKKYRLKKRLHLSSDTDLTKWLNDL